MPKNGRSAIRRIGISTGGGDAPGLNAVIRAVTLSAHNRGWEVVGIRDGYNGVMLPDQYRDGGLISLTPDKVRGITHLGGTIIGTTNQGNPLRFPVKKPNGKIVEVDRTDELVRGLQANSIDAVVAIGGDGSLTIANALAKKGVRIVGVPKTIDNDLSRTVVTFGFDTAVSFATECIDRLHTTAASHRRVMVVEVMGRYAGLDRAQRRHLRHRRRDPDPRDPLRPEVRARRRSRPASRRATTSRSSWWRRARARRAPATR